MYSKTVGNWLTRFQMIPLFMSEGRRDWRSNGLQNEAGRKASVRATRRLAKAAERSWGHDIRQQLARPPSLASKKESWKMLFLSHSLGYEKGSWENFPLCLSLDIHQHLIDGVYLEHIHVCPYVCNFCWIVSNLKESISSLGLGGLPTQKLIYLCETTDWWRD